MTKQSVVIGYWLGKDTVRFGRLGKIYGTKREAMEARAKIAWDVARDYHLSIENALYIIREIRVVEVVSTYETQDTK